MQMQTTLKEARGVEEVLVCPAVATWMALYGTSTERTRYLLTLFQMRGSAEKVLEQDIADARVAGMDVSPLANEQAKQRLEDLITVANSCGARLPVFGGGSSLSYVFVGGMFLAAGFFGYRYYKKKNGK